MIITATEFKTNFGKYLEIVKDEDIFITKNGKIIAQLSTPNNRKLSALRRLIGIANNGNETSIEAIKDERLMKQC